MVEIQREHPTKPLVKPVPSKPIDHYGLIGNLISAGLVGRDGSIDWLCLPRFDSPACFAALLGGPEHGHWSIKSADADAETRRCYLTDTAVIETRFETEDGAATVTDFMPLSDDEQRVDVVRLVRGERGFVRMTMELVLRFNYGQAVPWVRRRDYGLSAICGPDAVELHTPVKMTGKDMKTVASFSVREGDSIPFVLSYHPSHKTPQFVADSSETLARTVSWWREWTKHCKFDCKNEAWREAVIRSLITLKLLIYKPTGGIIAAPTTSLPEEIGGSRNWDYRYCWLRDSALTLYALLNAGYRDEAEAWRQWLLRAAAGHPQQVHIMYGVAGERWLPENEVAWLPGYEDSRPVRVGNGAAHQTQLDIYGNVMETLHAATAADLSPLDEAWRMQKVLLAHLETVWNKPDHGIWEMRGATRHFTHSRMMCWVAFDRAVKGCERFGLDGPADRWRKVRDAIHADICANGFDRRRNAFVQSYEGDSLDAALLLMPQVGFLPPGDPRVIGTVDAVEKELLRDGLVRRYNTQRVSDGVGGDEGAFLACSFWLVDAYILIGRREKAVELFERLLAVRSDLGLLSEEYDCARARLVGNYPQSYSHVGLVNSAYNMIAARGPAAQRSQSIAPTGAQHAGPSEGRDD